MTTETATATETPKVGDLNTYIDENQMKADVSINAADLDSAMMEHASLFVHYGSNTVRARRQYDRIKSAVEILEAKLDTHYREHLANEGKKVTEAMITTAIKSDPRWSQAQAKELDAYSIWKMCEVAESALVQRKDLILEIARDRRKEREGQLRVMEVQEREVAAGSAKEALVNSLRNHTASA